MSNSNKHTSPPWEIEYTEDNGFQINAEMHAICTNLFCYADEWKANAKLIAAAPDLLDALETIVECGYIEDAYQPTIDLVMNVINKARGVKDNEK